MLYLVNIEFHNWKEGENIMAESGGKADKGRKEQKKKPKMTIKEKRKAKNEAKKNAE